MSANNRDMEKCCLAEERWKVRLIDSRADSWTHFILIDEQTQLDVEPRTEMWHREPDDRTDLPLGELFRDPTRDVFAWHDDAIRRIEPDTPLWKLGGWVRCFRLPKFEPVRPGDPCRRRATCARLQCERCSFAFCRKCGWARMDAQRACTLPDKHVLAGQKHDPRVGCPAVQRSGFKRPSQ